MAIRMIRSPSISFRLAAVLPFIVAFTIWSGHVALRCDLIEHDRDCPLCLITVVADVPPLSDISSLTSCAGGLLIPLEAAQLEPRRTLHSRVSLSRGPPRPA